MIFNVITIRIDNETGVFQNTEVNQTMLLGDLEKELIDNGCDFSQMENCLALAKGERTICESVIYAGVKRGRRYTYIYRIG
jgi:hypothetical protein